MRLVKLGNDTINLDHVRSTYYVPDTDRGGTLHIFFTDQCSLSFHGLRAQALQHYLDLAACDLDEAEAIAAAAKEPTREALRVAGLVPAPHVTAAEVWQAAQDAFRRMSNELAGQYSATGKQTYWDLLDLMEQEAKKLPGNPYSQPVPQSREVSAEAFGDLLATHLADGQMDWGGED